MKQMFTLIKEKLLANEDLMLVTIIEASGSTPRGAGSHMLIGSAGRLLGTIGGGFVEYKAGLLAAEYLAKKRSGLHTYSLTQNDIEDLGMICGGTVTVFLRYLSSADDTLIPLCDRALGLFEERRAFWLISELDGKYGLRIFEKEGKELPEELSDISGNLPLRLSLSDTYCFCECLSGEGFVYILGGGHVSQALVPILASVGFSCIVLDDREEFLKKELFPGAVTTMACNFQHLSDTITVTANDYCCVLTRGHAYDTILQAQLLRTPAKYIGVIGSRKKKAAAEKKLRLEYGFTPEELSRVYCPIGLSIHAETPAEIAISITGEMIAVRAEG